MIYFDCSRGASGDMLLGALLDLGEDKKEQLEKALSRAGFDGLKIKSENKIIDGVSGTAVKFITNRKPLAVYGEVKEALENIKVGGEVKREVEKTYAVIFEAEAAVHNTSPEKVHLHELASFSTFLQILSFYILSSGEEIYSSTLPVGTGTVKTAHGRLPLPVPATAEILKGAPVKVTPRKEELITPTAAAILKNSAKFGAVPNFIIEKTGWGMGQRNFLRAIKAEKITGGGRNIFQIEVNIDDMTAEDISCLMERLREFSREVYSLPALMKKGRPGTVITALVEEKLMDSFRECLFQNSSAIGYRFFKVERDVIGREVVKFKSSYGEVDIKISEYKDKRNIKPEYGDLKEISKDSGLAVSELRRNIIKEYNNE